jgi:hypothetical protein
VDGEVNNLHVKGIGIEDLVGYVYIVTLDKVIIIQFIMRINTFYNICNGLFYL